MICIRTKLVWRLSPVSFVCMQTQMSIKLTRKKTYSSNHRLGFGDYLEIPNYQVAIGTDGTLGSSKICGAVFNVANQQVVHQTICSWTTPFRLGVHFDADETTGVNTADAHGFIENETSTAGSGIGITGFWLDYWQNTC